MEAYRCLPGEPALARLEAEAFDQRLVAHYQQESGQAQKMIDDLGGELDFYALAEELPQQQDLLDEQDDAPIIRLINALLSEAIKERASDIHIETYESELVIRFRIDGALRRDFGAAAQAGGAAGVAHQGDVEAGYRREARAAGWAHGAEGRRASD